MKPNFEEALGWARKPMRIPIPDRSSKWYAMGPYRAAILDAEEKLQDFEHAVLDYRQTGNELPERAAQVRASTSAEDERFERMQEQAREGETLERQREVLEANSKRQRVTEAAEKREGLRESHRQGRSNAVLENEDLAEPKEPVVMKKRRHGMELPQAAGRPLVAQTPTFREVNGQRRDIGAAAAVQPGEDEVYQSYEAARRLL